MTSSAVPLSTVDLLKVLLGFILVSVYLACSLFKMAEEMHGLPDKLLDYNSSVLHYWPCWKALMGNEVQQEYRHIALGSQEEN